MADRGKRTIGLFYCLLKSFVTLCHAPSVTVYFSLKWCHVNKTGRSSRFYSTISSNSPSSNLVTFTLLLFLIIHFSIFLLSYRNFPSYLPLQLALFPCKSHARCNRFLHYEDLPSSEYLQNTSLWIICLTFADIQYCWYFTKSYDRKYL
jgi:hypothetical protein